MKSAFLFISMLVLGFGCSERFPSQPKSNLPPETYVSLMPDSSLRRTTSQQHVHWWGVDQDGLVKGYLFSFDSVQWHYTTLNDSVFSLRLNTQDTTYSFFVSAVDNNGNGVYDSQTPWGPEPFTDLNGNGRWDAGEPFVDLGAVDPTPASLRYPIRNSPPKVTFVLRTDVPETTYAVASFQWSATDLDGNETINSFEYVLDDTSNPSQWKQIPGSSTQITLFNSARLSEDPTRSMYKEPKLTEGNHVFFLRAKDVAGAYSPTIRMPDTTKIWHVRAPRGDFLIVDDYAPGGADGFYNAMFDTLMNGRLGRKDIWDIKTGASSISRGKYVPALINPTFTETLKLFDYVFWYSDNSPSLDIAQASLPGYKQAGGKVLFSSGFPENVSGQGSLVDFAPIDNVESNPFATKLFAGDSLVAVGDPNYPSLVVDNTGFIYAFPRGVLPKVNARIIYRMSASSRWTGQPIMGVKDADSPKFILLAGLLHRFGVPPNNAAQFLRKVFKDEFGVQ